MKHLYQFSLLLLVLLLPAFSLAHDFEVDGIYYNINGNEVTVTYKGTYYAPDYNEYTGSVTIPTTVTYGGKTYSVTTIDSWAFYKCRGLTSITIPNSVTTIGWYAFQGCSGLTSITIPNSVTAIGDDAFDDTPWYNSQPNGLIYAGLMVYTYKGTMSSGTSIFLRDGTIGIADGAFSGCTGMIGIDIPNSVISIGGYAFSNCRSLTSVTIPNSVTTIGNMAFQECSSLTSIDISNSVTSISYGTFYGCTGLTSIDIPNSVISLGENAFSGCSGLTSITIPNSVTSVSNMAFEYCSGLTSITIPNSVTAIGYAAFQSCTALSSITVASGNPKYDSRNSCNAIIETSTNKLITGCKNTVIPNSVTSIGIYAFRGCSGLTSIDIPNSVTSIGGYAFSGCSGLVEICSFALTPPTIGSYETFNGCYGASLFVLDESVNAYKSADYWGNFNIIAAIGSLVPGSTFVIDGIYYRVTDVNAVSVMANEEVEAYYTGDVVIPDSVTYEEISFAVTGIENNAFDGCFELTSVVIPNSVETIGEQAFQGCTGLTSVTIGSGVTVICTKAFNYCNALENVKCISTVPPAMASSDCFSTAAYNRATLLVPRQQIETYQAADYWYKFTHIDGWGSGGRGDVNEDGNVNISDVTALIDYLLSSNASGINLSGADCNQDSSINISDVTALINYLLTGNWN